MNMKDMSQERCDVNFQSVRYTVTLSKIYVTEFMASTVKV
jgi:hypothetical protein